MTTTGWPPGLLQDDSRKLSDWFASRIDARHTVRKVCAEIQRKRMSTKLRIKFEIVIEYDADPKNYPEGHRTPEAMLAVDLASAENDPFALLGGNTDSWTTTGEVVQP